jgi:starvation-inducible DNA-binding protein
MINRQTESSVATQSQPLLRQKGEEIQRFGELRYMPIALGEDARAESVHLVNGILADSIILYNLYKKHHWLMRGHTFYQLHLLLDKHAEEQLALIDLMGERVQTLGGVAVADPRHVAEITTVERPPNGAEEVPVMLSRLIDAHEIVIQKIRVAIERTDESKDWGTNDLLMSDVLRKNEIQAWFIAEHLVDTPVVRI